MDNLEQKMQQAAAARGTRDQTLQAIFIEAYNLKETTDKKPEVGHMAYGMLAVDVSMRLANMFLAIKADKGVHEVACDLSYELAVNEFWAKNASILVPIMHVALNTHRDGVMLLVEKTIRDEYSKYDMLISASQAAPLEIFPVIAYCLGGPGLMVSASLKLKLALAPYFL